MSKDIYQSETYEHKNGLKYHVCWYIDHDSQSPLEWTDCHGVTERMDWNPTNAEQLEQHIADCEPEVDEVARLTLMRQLCRPSNYYDSGLYYDVLTSLHHAKTEWGCKTHEDCVAAVERDFAYLKGWYDNDWFWLTIGVAPINVSEDGVEEIDEDSREFCGGYESTILNNDPDNEAWRIEVINDQIAAVEWMRRKHIHKNQLELAL